MPLEALENYIKANIHIDLPTENETVTGKDYIEW